MRTIQILGCFSVSFFLFEEAGILKPEPNGNPLKFITANFITANFWAFSIPNMQRSVSSYHLACLTGT